MSIRVFGPRDHAPATAHMLEGRDTVLALSPFQPPDASGYLLDVDYHRLLRVRERLRLSEGHKIQGVLPDTFSLPGSQPSYFALQVAGAVLGRALILASMVDRGGYPRGVGTKDVQKKKKDA